MKLLAGFRSVSPLAEAMTPGLLTAPALVGLRTIRTIAFEPEASAPRLNTRALPLVTIAPCDTAADRSEPFAGIVFVKAAVATAFGPLLTKLNVLVSRLPTSTVAGEETAEAARSAT